MRNLIIICQAPADVQYVVNIYKENTTRNVIIIVINVLKVFHFLKSLNLQNVAIYYIPYELTSYKNIFAIMRERNRLCEIWIQFRALFANSEVYFFSIFEDWITGYLVDKIDKETDSLIYYCNHYDNADIYSRRKVSYSNCIRLILLKYLTGVSFKGEISEKFPEYSIPSRCKYMVPTHRANNEFYYKVSNGKNCILFLSASDGQLYTYDSYIHMVCITVNTLRSESYTVYLKAHPRVGMQKELAEIEANIIPEYIPSEFIDTTQFSLCLGFESTSLASFANEGVKTYSLLSLLQIVQEDQFAIIKQYLLEMSEYKIQFVSNLSVIGAIGNENK